MKLNAEEDDQIFHLYNLDLTQRKLIVETPHGRKVEKKDACVRLSYV